MSSMYGVLYAFISAGFYEEFTFRGFLMQGLAMLFGGSRSAWIGACVLQGALFGAAHAYQNPLGIAITGTLGILMGLLVLASGRNLWAVIIGHGPFDASFRGAPGGRALPSSELSAIQQARIESILDRLANFYFFEIGMLRIYQKVHLT